LIFSLVKRTVLWPVFLMCLVFSCVMSGVSYSSKEDALRLEALIKKEIIARTPALKDSRIKVSFRDPERVSSLPGNDFRLAYPSNLPLSGDVVIPVDIYSAGVFKERANIRASVRIFRNVVIAGARIRQGDVFGRHNTAYSEKDVTYLPANYMLDAKKVIGRRSSTFIPKGALVLDWMPEDVPVVTKGETVNLFKRVNGVFVKARAIALEDGYINGNIRVRNTGSNKIVEGRITGTGEVEAI
jgi:flagellar basal body P-ring formation protein FlgA